MKMFTILPQQLAATIYQSRALQFFHLLNALKQLFLFQLSAVKLIYISFFLDIVYFFCYVLKGNCHSILKSSSSLAFKVYFPTQTQQHVSKQFSLIIKTMKYTLRVI